MDAKIWSVTLLDTLSASQLPSATPFYMKTHVFVKVRDASRRPVRGLYRRDGVFYARLTWDGVRGWHRLEKAQDVDSAKQTMAALESLRARGEKPPAARQHEKMTFAEFCDEYLRLIRHTKKPATVKNEGVQISGVLKPFFGKLRLDLITQHQVEDFRARRLKAKRSARTVNLNIVVLRNVLTKAMAFSYLKTDPTKHLQPLKMVRKMKVFLPLETIRKAAEWVRKNVREGGAIADAILFLAFTGARRSEGLAVRWEDVDFKQERVWIGASGDTKNHSARYVDFYPDLKELLLSMKDASKDGEFLFPSYRSPDDVGYGHLLDIREAIKLARTKLSQPHWSPHDLRHHFASRCVMAGIDFKQTAAWLGHRDGGILVATVYGHLVEGHGKIQALKLQPTGGLTGDEKVNQSEVPHSQESSTVDNCRSSLNHHVEVCNPHPGVASPLENRETVLSIPAPQGGA